MGLWRQIAALAAVTACVAGCGDAPETVVLAAEASAAPAYVPPPESPRIDYPDLARGRYYTVSKRTPLQSALPNDKGEAPRVEKLPAHGIFQVIDRRAEEDGLWYRVLVSNGAEDYTMYLDAADVNGQDVALFEPPPPAVEDAPAPRSVSIPRVRLY